MWADGWQKRLYIEPIQVGDPIRVSAMGTVVLSKSKKWAVGDMVYGDGDWAEYSTLRDSGPLTGKRM